MMKKYMETKSKERKNLKFNAGSKEYYQYLKDLKNDTENNEYSVSFMTF